VYPALAVLDRLNDKYRDVQTLWVGAEGGMEEELVTGAGIDFTAIPAAGVHGVGIRRLPGNAMQIARGVSTARRVIGQYQPDVLFFTGGYVAVPVALAGRRIPTVLYIPDIEPGMALKFLARFSNRIALTAEESNAYLPRSNKTIVTGYPVRQSLSNWEIESAYKAFDLSPEMPILLVTGGSLGSRSINQAVSRNLPALLKEMQVIHITGKLTWPEFNSAGEGLSDEEAACYRSYPYLHERMGAAYLISDLVISRAGASSLGEYPQFGLPAVLVPYPYAWRYQMVNANYLAQNGAAVILEDEEIERKLLDLVKDLMGDSSRRQEMAKSMKKLASSDPAASIAKLIIDTAFLKEISESSLN
jgi:UDP-N-acetylglucosamine--N-acetylmuramyl-(pentapeptide) pyrophosphoryl-undecaprenol N-acetylglucosamine transferase